MGNGSSGVLSQEFDLLEHFRLGDADAFETLFRTHQRSVYGWVLRIVRNTAAAEDITVEVFWRIYNARARFEAGRGFEPWARRIATHAALDWLRARRPESELTADVMAGQAATGADPAVTAELRVKTAQAFGRLPAGLRPRGDQPGVVFLARRRAVLAEVVILAVQRDDRRRGGRCG